MTPKSAVLQRFERAVTLLGYAIGHVLSGYPDSALTVLRATWDDLKDSLIGNIEYLATAAFIYAVDGNTRHAEHVLEQTLDELSKSWNNLPQNVRNWAWERCVLTMDRLPYAHAIAKHVNDAYAYSNGGNFAEALYQLTLANDILRSRRRVTPPATAASISTAWTDILERMLIDERTTTLAHVRRFTARAGTLAHA